MLPPRRKSSRVCVYVLIVRVLNLQLLIDKELMHAVVFHTFFFNRNRILMES